MKIDFYCTDISEALKYMKENSGKTIVLDEKPTKQIGGSIVWNKYLIKRKKILDVLGGLDE